MLASTALLTFITLLGLAVGFIREMLLVSSWGASSQTDAFLVAMFLPEAIRMALTSGLLTAAALPQWLQQSTSTHQQQWSVSQTLHMLLLGILLAVLFSGLSSLWAYLVGPGLSASAHQQAADALRIVAWTLPFILLHALLSVFHAAKQQFLFSGLGSLLFNLPAVLYLLYFRDTSSMRGLAYCFLVGSVLMTLILIPLAQKNGWRFVGKASWLPIKNLYQTLLPLLASTGASQGLTLAERIIASHLGEGAITLLNLARKLMNIPMIGLLSLSQVLLSYLSKNASHDDRLQLLRTSLSWASLLSLPASVLLLLGAQPLVVLLLPDAVSQSSLPTLVMLFAIGLCFGSWNGLLARYFYAQNDTRTPLKFELSGNALNLILAIALASSLGLAALPLAASLGVMLTSLLLIRQTPLAPQLPKDLLRISFFAATLGALVFAVHHLQPLNAYLQLTIACALSAGLFIALILWLKPKMR
jgi:hypothetical protein